MPRQTVEGKVAEVLGKLSVLGEKLNVTFHIQLAEEDYKNHTSTLSRFGAGILNKYLIITKFISCVIV